MKVLGANVAVGYGLGLAGRRWVAHTLSLMYVTEVVTLRPGSAAYIKSNVCATHALFDFGTARHQVADNAHAAEVPWAQGSRRRGLLPAPHSLSTDSLVNDPTQRKLTGDDSSCRFLIICGKSLRHPVLRVLLPTECL